MAVFVAASDETNSANGLYHYAGWLAPEPDWSLYFTPAWQERVLDGPPKIPYVHMTDVRSRAWREQWHVTQTDVDERLDEAARVIDQMGSLYPFKITIDTKIFKPLYKPHKMLVASGAATDYKPDFLGFVSYAFGVLAQVHFKYPEAEKVDFLVENNSEVTKHIHQLYRTLPESLKQIGRPELVPLVGDFVAAGKERVPLQAADYLCWHSQRADAQTLSDIRDLRRWNTIAQRKGFNMLLPTSVLTDLAAAFAKRERENDKTNGSGSFRQNHARSDKRIARRNKKGTRRRKSNKDAKK